MNESRQGRKKNLSNPESPCQDKVRAKEKRKALIKVSTKTTTHSFTPTQPESMLQNTPKPDPLTSHQLFNLPLLYNHSYLQGLPGQL